MQYVYLEKIAYARALVSAELDWQDVGLYSSKEFAEQICGQLNETIVKKQ